MSENKKVSKYSPILNNKRTHPAPVHGAPEFTQDFAEVDTGNEIAYVEEPRDRYKSLPASAYALDQQLKQGVPLQKTGVYMQIEKMHGADVATRAVTRLQEQIDEHNLRVARADLLKRHEEDLRKIVSMSSPASAPASAPPSVPAST